MNGIVHGHQLGYVVSHGQACRLAHAPGATGVEAFLAQQNATTPVYSITTGVSTLLMHSFLIWRYYMLPKDAWKNWLVVPVLSAGAITAFIGDMLATYSVIHFTSLADRPKLTQFATCVSFFSFRCSNSLTDVIVYSIWLSK
jgi:hypothetical protein